MKKNLTYAAAICIAMLASCSNEPNEGGQVIGEGEQLTTITLTTGSYTKSAGPSTLKGDKALFNDQVPITLYAYASEDMSGAPLATKIVDLVPAGDVSLPSQYPGTADKYTIDVVLPIAANSVNVVLNGDDSYGDSGLLTEFANSRQTHTKEIAVQIDAKSVTLNGNGKITKTDDKGSATIVLRPEMARLEMLNTIPEGYGDEEVNVTDAEGVTEQITRAKILSHYKDLKISATFQDDVILERDGSKVDNNTTVQGWGTLPVSSSTTGAYRAADGTNNKFVDIFDSTVGEGVITNATGVLATDFTDFFGDVSAYTDPTTGGNVNYVSSVGYNIFPQAALDAAELSPAVADNVAAAKAQHPHFVIEIQYNKSTGFKGGFGGDAFDPIGYETELTTAYINLAAFIDNSNASNNLVQTFMDGKVYQFTLESVLDILTDLDPGTTPDPGKDPDPVTPPTEEPDEKYSVAIDVQVLDWEVVPVTPLPL